VLEHGAHDVDLFALKDLAQLLLQPYPSVRTVVILAIKASRSAEAAGFKLERRSLSSDQRAMALEGPVGSLLDAAHLVQAALACQTTWNSSK
jgi:hypothetical protein